MNFSATAIPRTVTAAAWTRERAKYWGSQSKLSDNYCGRLCVTSGICLKSILNYVYLGEVAPAPPYQKPGPSPVTHSRQSQPRRKKRRELLAFSRFVAAKKSGATLGRDCFAARGWGWRATRRAAALRVDWQVVTYTGGICNHWDIRHTIHTAHTPPSPAALQMHTNKYGSVQELRSTIGHLEYFKILGWI